MTTFFQNSSIYRWQRAARSQLIDALNRSRKASSLHHSVRRLIRPECTNTLSAVSTYSRTIWGEAICRQFSGLFCDGGDGSSHQRGPLWVTLCDQKCVRRRDQLLTNDDLAKIKHRLRNALYGLNYVAIIEPAYYVNWQNGYGPAKSATCVSWHLHAVVWGISKTELKKRLKASQRKGYYQKLARGLRPTHVELIKRGGLPKVAAYMVKWPRSTYRVTRSLAAGSHKSDDGTRRPRLYFRFKQQPSRLRPGEVITYLTLLGNLRLNDLTFGGGKGTALLLEVKRTLDSRDISPTGTRGRKNKRRGGRRCLLKKQTPRLGGHLRYTAHTRQKRGRRRNILEYAAVLLASTRKKISDHSGIDHSGDDLSVRHC